MGKIYDFFGSKIPYGTLKARTGDPYEWVLQHINEIPLEKYNDNSADRSERNSPAGW